jgi:ribonuclease G
MWNQLMKKIIINDTVWQTRIAIAQDGVLENMYYASPADQTLERAYYKGTVAKVLPGIQTAFVDIGQERAGFLHISEIDRELAIEKFSKTTQLDEDEPITRVPRKKLDIANILKEGDSILVQVSKEPVYEKGAKLTTCFTLPGRYLVLMPNIPRIGVSKKIENRDERHRLRDIVRANLPEGMGAIIRTTSEDRKESDLIKDINYLVQTWNMIQKRYASAQPKERIYEDLPLTLQIVRDHLDEDVEAVICDNKETQKNLHNFVKLTAPELTHLIKQYRGKTDLFDFYGVEKQIREALEKKIHLKSGGSLILETTEAMTVIDVNTGRFTGKKNMEDTIFKTNMEAAEEAARQLRLRNIGGLIVIDFIDMAIAANRQKVFRFFEKILRERDKFQSVVLKISEFGLVQMTRKRSGKTLQQLLTDVCTCCHGLGFIKSVQVDSYEVLRHLSQEMENQKPSGTITIQLNPDVFDYISKTEYNAILALEKEFGTKITLSMDKKLSRHSYHIEKI